jgi:hypothetical protein
MLHILIYVTCLVLFASVDNAAAERLRYDGDQVLLFPVRDVEQWNRVLDIINEHVPVQDRDIWKVPSVKRPGYVRVPKVYVSEVRHSLQAAEIDFSVFIDDVQSLIAKSEEVVPKNEQLRRPGAPRADIVGTFPTYGEILTWMNELSAQYPEIVSTFSIGNTYEGRPMQVLKLGVGGTTNKWKVWLDAGFHAREWIAPTTAVYVIDQLITGWANGDAEIRAFLEKLDFHIMPSANPDGYEYTHTTDRLWRKNRKPDAVSGCIGVDLNRNFGFQWGGANADPDPCSTMFMGPIPESEIEVLNVVQHILPQASSFIMYHSYHSWGEQFFTRWDYTATEVPPDHDELLALAWKAVNAINAVHNQTYEAGTSPVLMYPFSGSSADWSRGAAQIKYPYLQELRDANGDYAFVPPPTEIIPCGEENWAGFLVLLREIMANYGNVTPPAAAA